MYSTNPVASPKPAAVMQLNIFGDYDETPAPPSTRIPAKPSGPAARREGPQPKRTTPAVLSNPITPAAPPCAPQSSPELLVDPDEPVSVDLESISSSDTPESILAKRMFLRMMWDIEGKADEVEPDLFGQTSATSADHSDQNRLDALIWLYGLNPDAGLVTIEWVCDNLQFDVHRVRRIVGRSLRKELKRLLHLLSTIVGEQHAQVCEEKLSDYLDASNWRMN